MQKSQKTSSGKGSEEHTPLMKQFFAAKSEHPDVLLFFRMGDFYELFFEDAVKAAGAPTVSLWVSATASDYRQVAAGVKLALAERGGRAGVFRVNYAGKQVADDAERAGVLLEHLGQEGCRGGVIQINGHRPIL